MDYNIFLELVKNRRTIRKFLPDPVSSEDVGKIVEAARWAPSGFNSQPWEAVIVTDPELKDKVTQILQGKDDVADISRTSFAVAPAYILFYGDLRVRNWAPKPVRENEEIWQYVFEASLAAGFEHMHLAATSLGLGAMWVTASRFSEASEAIKELLNLPDYLSPFEMLAIGYPNHTPPEKKLRSLESMMHEAKGEAIKFRSLKEIEAFFGKKERKTKAE
ncbi:nitroreductase family protein [Halodesulfovibrio marinisediminis]|uniref:Nitroreductase n=1 Tax=Halodesulfovibrio marinisediminis DSM 17456 TaxID=1121457 RepID=A0A1N6E9Y3_9BACT|nr:nitroreductase family protein [Halodesulfovibrio marinisediminis]SIN79796.1 Nitroreductase [Halodesulfovibrio marinisediminis DSM 17456]